MKPDNKIVNTFEMLGLLIIRLKKVTTGIDFVKSLIFIYINLSIPLYGEKGRKALGFCKTSIKKYIENNITH